MALVDQYGRPFPTRKHLTTAVAGPSLTGVRQAWSGHPSKGLTPQKLERILREAEDNDPIRYYELAEDLEEKDWHYASVIRTRKLAVAQLDLSVESASDNTDDVRNADLVRAFLARDTVEQEVVDILDALAKGISFTEILWRFQAGQWLPDRLEWRDPRWFLFDRADMTTPKLRDHQGQPLDLQPGKFIVHTPSLKSGIPVRGGLARLAGWAWLFKSFTVKDWVMLAETFGHPLRLGKYPAGASDEEREKLFQAVQNLGTDACAVVSADMVVEFVNAQSTQVSSDLYRALCSYIDQQISKAVLGQTATTDAISGGHAVGQEHQEIREDIERADAKALAATLNRDLVRPMILLNFGEPAAGFPRIVIGRPESLDMATLVPSLTQLVPMGLKVGMSDIRDRLGLPEPDPDQEVLVAPVTVPNSATDPFGDPRNVGGYGGPNGTRNRADATQHLGSRAGVDTPALALHGRETTDMEDLVGALLADGPEIGRAMEEAILQAVADASGFHDLVDRLIRLAGEDRPDAAPVAAALRNLGFAVRVAGRLGEDFR